MGPAVSISLEEIMSFLSIAGIVTVSHHCQDCGDVIFLIQAVNFRASSSTLAPAQHQVSLQYELF